MSAFAPVRTAALALGLALAAASTVLAQHTPAGRSVQLIPHPRQITVTTGSFPIGDGARIVLADRRSEDDRFAAEDLVDELRASAGFAPAIGGRGGRRILIGPIAHEDIRERLAAAGAVIPDSLDPEGYVLTVTPSEIVIGGASAAGTFYGVQTLKQLVRGHGTEATVPALRIVDWPAMRWRGLSDDISRGPVPTMEYMKRQIRTMAAFKMNMYSLYMEHVFATVSHPLIAPEGGGITADQAREIVAYAKRYHVEVVPELQTFGHLHKVLKIQKYAASAEVPFGDMIAAGDEDGLRLIADQYRELADAFPGRFFHIGADETFELGHGRSKPRVEAEGVGAVYFDHLNRVRGILAPHGRQLMFWGDIARNHPELLPQVPRDLIVVNWAYGPRESFVDLIKPFQDAGLQQIIAPGVQNWNQVFPNTDAAAVNIPNFIRDGQAAGAIGVLNTSWDDDGDTFFEQAWYGVVLGAAASWEPAPLDVARFERDFDWAFFRAEGDSLVRVIRALGSVNRTLGLSYSNLLFWQDPFTAAFVVQAREKADSVREMRLRAERAEETLYREARRVRRNREMIPALHLAARRLDHMGRRMQYMEQLSRDYWSVYLGREDPVARRNLRNSSSLIYNGLREMAEEMAALKEQFRRQWLAESRPFWLESVLARFDASMIGWLQKSKQMEEVMRGFRETGQLPDPESLGFGPNPWEST